MPTSGVIENGKTMIYVVEDDEPVRDSLVALLESEGFDALPYATGDAFLAHFHPGGDACLILDLALPGTGGLELLEQVPDATIVVVPIGGGGLISGVAAYVKAVRPDIKVIGVQSTDSDAMARSLKAGRDAVAIRRAHRQGRVGGELGVYVLVSPEDLESLEETVEILQDEALLESIYTLGRERAHSRSIELRLECDENAGEHECERSKTTHAKDRRHEEGSFPRL